MRHRRLLLLSLFALGASLFTTVQAQDFPSKPSRFVVPFPPGSGTDTSARYFAKKFTELTGQTVVVDNKPGANGFIAVRSVLTAPADGYTVFVGSNSTLAVNVALFKSLPYDPVADFSPLSMMMRAPALLVVPAQSSYNTVNELVAAAKAQPGKLNYATSGVGSPGQLAGALLESMTGVTLNHVPYKGGGPAITDLVAGHIPSFIAVISTAVPHVLSGKARALAVTGGKRAEALPDVPTIAEAGVKDYLATNWYGLSAPARTAPNIINRLNADFTLALRHPEVIKQFKERGIEPAPYSGAD
jgi:tripartite-type tricarboxylate transporter receptor subunit TctC